MMDSNDKAFHNLIEKLNHGDQLAFDELYKRCSGHVAFVCQKFCDSKEDVEEVVQDTFVIAFKKVGELRGDTLMAYLRKIAIHESLRKRNANLRVQQYVVSVDDEQTERHHELDTDFLPEEYLQNKENRIELLQVIKSLPKMQWKMIYMYYYASLSTNEMAVLLDCTTQHVYKTLHIARKTIKGKLEGTGKKKAAKGTASASLAALFFMEEQAFAASYVSIAAPSIAGAGVAGKAATTTATSIKGYVIAACALAVCAATAAVYVVSQPAAEDYVYVPTYEIYVPAAEAPATVEDMEDIVREEAPLETLPEPTEEVQQSEPVVEVSTEALGQVEEPGGIPEPEPPEAFVDENELDEPDEPEPAPEPIDRTPEILAALAAAGTPGDVASIVRRYGFQLETSMRHATGRLYRFYTLNEGGGGILIGTVAYEDGTGWRMRFQHFAGGQMPVDTLDRFRFMEQ